MTSLVYQKQGLTTAITANTTAVTGNITVANSGGGACVVKVDNISNANTDIFLNWSTANTVVATIANATSTGNSVCIQHGTTQFIRVQGSQTPGAKVYFSAIAAAPAVIYITPVSIG